MPIEKDFDIPFISGMALREKQIQQSYRPIIAVHKWFARRPGTLFRGLLLSEFVDRPLTEAFFTANNLRGIRVADPFMGGGTPLIEANRLGCDVTGYDINPMAFWIVHQEIEQLDQAAYRNGASRLGALLEERLGPLYRTRCLLCGSPEASVKYFLWVKEKTCSRCGKAFPLFPGYLLAEDQRHPRNVLVCAGCGELNEVAERAHPGSCRSCHRPLAVKGPARRHRCDCPDCGLSNVYPAPGAGPPGHRMFALEYHCRPCKPHHRGRFFKKPDQDDLDRYAEACQRYHALDAAFVPDDPIPPGDETDRLLRWGYRRYREMFNPRQLLGLELSCRAIAETSDRRVRHALATNLSDLLRYQNLLCRYDTMALKSLDIFSVHGFPVGLVQCESNLLGIPNGGGVSVGSGGWSNIVEKYAKAKAYCDQPFEIRHAGGRKTVVPVPGEWIGDQRNGDQRGVELRCASATAASLPQASLDAVLTDPPYFGNVQYAELMDFCYVWLRRLLGPELAAFAVPSTRHPDELTGNITMDRGLDHFTEGLSAVFCAMARALKPGRPLVFTYHHNKLEAYYPLAVAILDAGLTCSASLPCPAEMGASIHISGTGSSVVDTVFVCRSTGTVPRHWLASSAAAVAQLVAADLEKLRQGGLSPSPGDVRCTVYGHLARMAIWRLRLGWERQQSVSRKLARMAQEIQTIATLQEVEAALAGAAEVAAGLPPRWAGLIQEGEAAYGESSADVSF
ncbi:MAG: DNA methylase [Thermodesulfobacteriota bacterium]